MTAIHTPALRAFHGDPAIKTKYIDRLATHRLADQLTQGMTWDDESQKGCAIGCTLHQYSHAAYETELGIPRVLARLEDGIFEGLSVADSREWPTRFLDAIHPGADLSLVWPRFAHWLLADPDHGVIRHAKTERSKKAIADVAALYFLWINGEKPSEKEWSAAADAAAYAADAAAAAADAADAASAAYAAYAADARSNARKDARKAQADQLVKLLSEAPVLK